jgi:hypothetical protein
MPPVNFKHNIIAHNLLRAFMEYAEQHQLGTVRIEVGFEMAPTNWLEPDTPAKLDRERNYSSPTDRKKSG